LVFNFWSSLYILDTNPLSDEELARIDFLSVVFLSDLVIVFPCDPEAF
jgi:hypothetical protein